MCIKAELSSDEAVIFCRIVTNHPLHDMTTRVERENILDVILQIGT